MKKIILFCLFSILLVSCVQKKDIGTETDEISKVVLSNANLNICDIEKPTQSWHQTDECICVLFGYGYNDADFVKKMTDMLFEQFGSYEDGGYIFPLVFPDDFKGGSKTYITNLENELSDKNVKGIILLGCPENTHKAIARLQDKWGGALPYPVFSFFPQDDVIAMEDSADFVLDKAQKIDLDGIAKNEEEQDFFEEVPTLLLKSVRYQIDSESPFAKDANLLNFVKMLDKDLTIERYADPDTNLLAINHFLITSQ